MKRLYTTLIGITLTIALFAQATPPHLKFMGIPIDGTITQFQAKLQAKGCTYDKVISSILSNTTRAFNGTFAGEEVKIFVYYDNKTKNVYRVKAIIEDETERIADSKYNKFKSLLTTKYGIDSDDIGEQDGKESVSFYATTKDTDPLDSSVMYTIQGVIDLYYSKTIDSDYISQHKYNIHIDYTDKHNNDKHNNTILNDI